MIERGRTDSAGGELIAARNVFAECADHGRGGLSELRIQFLGRCAGAGEDAACRLPSGCRRRSAAALANPGVKEKLARIGVDPMTLTSAEFQALIAKEIADNAELVKAAGLKAN